MFICAENKAMMELPSTTIIEGIVYFMAGYYVEKDYKLSLSLNNKYQRTTQFPSQRANPKLPVSMMCSLAAGSSI